MAVAQRLEILLNPALGGGQHLRVDHSRATPRWLDATPSM